MTPGAPDKRRHRLRAIMHGALFAALAAGVFGLLPQFGGVARDAAELRQASPWLIAAAVAAQAASLGPYAQLYRSVLASLSTTISLALSARVTLATFFVSHLTPFGSVTGALVNADALESAGVAATTTGEAVALTSLVSTVALLALFCLGLAVTAGQHVSQTYLLIGVIAAALAGSAVAAVLTLGARPALAGKAGRQAGRIARRFRPGIDPGKVADTWTRMASLARSALTGRALGRSLGYAAADLLLDLACLGLMFAALGCHPGFGPLLVAYCAANIASAIPVTPAGLGVIEVTLVAVLTGFGVPRATAVLAVLGYRIVNYWLPLLPGAVAYIRLRLGARPGTRPGAPRSTAAGSTAGNNAVPS